MLLAVSAAMASVLIGAAPRVLLAAGALPAPLRPFVWSDILHLWERGARDGHLPYRDVFFEYPPLVAGIWSVTETLAGSATVHVLLWALVQAAAAGTVALVLVRGAGARRALFWSLSPQLLLYGSVNVDALAVAAMVVGLALARRGRVVASALALAVGTAAKLFPAAVLPVVLVRPLARRDVRTTAAALLAFVLPLGVAFAPSATAPFSSLLSLERYAVGVPPNLDSVWGLLRGAVLVSGWDPLGAIVVVTLVGTLATFAFAVIPAARRSADPVVPAGLSITTLLLWSRLYSPQYALWVLPFFALAGLRRRTFALLTAADVAVFLTVYPLTLVRWPSGAAAPAALVGALAAAVILRHAGLVLAWRELWRASRRPVGP